MNPLKVIMLQTRSINEIRKLLNKDKIGYTEWSSEAEIRVEVEDIKNIDGFSKSYIDDVLRKTYAYNKEEIKELYEEYAYIIFF